MKKFVRILGVDDSPFSRKDRETYLIGTVFRATYPEGIIIKKITVDGMDSTEVIIKMLEGKFSQQVRVIFLHGLTFAGFNVPDIRKIYDETKIPVVTFSRKEPDFIAIENALKKHFNDWEIRLDLLKNIPSGIIKKGRSKIFVQFIGISYRDVLNLFQNTTIRGNMPEPLRLAHMIGSAIHFGYSKRKI